MAGKPGVDELIEIYNVFQSARWCKVGAPEFAQWPLFWQRWADMCRLAEIEAGEIVAARNGVLNRR